MIVTISRQYGAAGLDVAHRLGELIGYPLVGEDFPKIAAVRLGTTQEDIVATEYREPTLAERILHNLAIAVPESQAAVAAPSFETEVRKETEAAILEAAQRSEVIIVGGFANAVLRDRENVISSFLHAAMPFRIARVAAALGVDDEPARKEIERVDAARRRWAKLYYDYTWGSSQHYTLTIDVARFGIEGAARLLAHAVKESG
ncbi:MAG: AAA family ATPase [Vulcanimicrobiaceae bacterium]